MACRVENKETTTFMAARNPTISACHEYSKIIQILLRLRIQQTKIRTRKGTTSRTSVRPQSRRIGRTKRPIGTTLRTIRIYHRKKSKFWGNSRIT